jgi:hypothetical protein
VFTALQELSMEMETKLGTGDCARIGWHLPEDLFRRILGFLHGRYSPMDGLPEEHADLVCSFLAFFRGECQRFGVRQYSHKPDTEGGRGPLVTRFIRGEVDIQCRQHTVILDGSAFMSEVAWKGFRIVRCPELVRNYPNMTVDVIQKHPSARKLGEDEFFASYRERVLRFVEDHPEGEPLIVLVNKHLERKPKIKGNVEKILGEIRDRHPEVVEMGYGDHVGSNEGVMATGCVFCVGLFAPYSHYVLRAALAEGEPIPADQIWVKGGVFSDSKLSKYRFSNDAVHAAYVRSVTRDFMQGIFRGRIRDDSSLPYRVLLVVQGLSILSWLEKEFPGAKFDYPDRELCHAVSDGAPRAALAEHASSSGDGNGDVSERQGYSRVDRVADALQFIHPDEAAQASPTDDATVTEQPPVEKADEAAA